MKYVPCITNLKSSAAPRDHIETSLVSHYTHRPDWHCVIAKAAPSFMGERYMLSHKEGNRKMLRSFCVVGELGFHTEI